MSLGPQRVFLLGGAHIPLGTCCLEHFGTLVQFVCVAGPRTLLLALSRWWLIKLVAILIHAFLPWVTGSWILLFIPVQLCKNASRTSGSALPVG